jgi:hypothetical protein
MLDVCRAPAVNPAIILRISANFEDIDVRQNVIQTQKMHLADYVAQPISLI